MQLFVCTIKLSLYYTIVIGLLNFIFITPCYALSTDKQQPAYLEADSANLNHKTQTGTYRGHVKLTQGSTVLTADTLITHLDANNHLQEAICIGKQATYSTLPDNTNLTFNAAGDTINYYPSQQQVDLIGNAKATQGADTFAGPKIHYDIKQQTIITPKSPQGKTTMTIQPQQKLVLPKQ